MLGIDVHCHLEYMEETEKVIEQARQRMHAFITSVADPKDAERMFNLTENKFVHLSLGFHPSHCDDYNENQKNNYFEFIRKNKNKIVAIGETGLDYNWIKEKEKQLRSRDIFLKMVALSKELKLPLVIHSRNRFENSVPIQSAVKDILDILADKDCKDVVMHCFSGSESELKTAMNMGCWISFATLICKSEKHKRFAKIVPLEQMLLETDAPWLDPDSKEMVNRPWKIYRSAEIIANIKNISQEEVLKQTQKNAEMVFGI